MGDAARERVLQLLRQAHEECERTVADELTLSVGEGSSTQKELKSLRGRNTTLQRDLDKMTQQKAYVADAFENQRVECQRLRNENEAQARELERMRALADSLEAERAVEAVSHTLLADELTQIDVERDVLGRALGAATRQLFGQAQAQGQGGALANVPAGKQPGKQQHQPSPARGGTPPKAAPKGSGLKLRAAAATLGGASPQLSPHPTGNGLTPKGRPITLSSYGM